MHELLKRFARSKLLREEKQHLDAAYTSFYSGNLRSYAQASDKTKLESRDYVYQDIDNYRKTWELMLEEENLEALSDVVDAVYNLYFNKSLFYEGHEKFEKALTKLQTLESVPDLLLGKVQQSLAVFKMYLGNVADAKALFLQALSVLKNASAHEEQAYIYKQLGLIAKQQHQYDEALAAFDDSLMLFRSLEDEVGEAHALNSIGITLKNQEKFSEAETFLLNSLEMFERLGLEDDAAIANHNLGSVALMQDEFEKAKVHYLESLRTFETYDFRHGIAASHTNLGNVELKLGNYQKALVHLEQSVALKREAGDLVSLPEPLRQMALCFHGLRKLDKAVAKLSEALCLSIGSQPISFIVELLIDLAQILGDAGETKKAKDLLEFAQAYTTKAFIKPYLDSLSRGQGSSQTLAAFDIEPQLKDIRAQYSAS